MAASMSLSSRLLGSTAEVLAQGRQAAPCSVSLSKPSTPSVSASRSVTSMAVVYAPPSTARVDLLKDAEERWQRAENSPLDGVSFTPLEFEEALEKYDISFDVGDKVKGVVFKLDNAGALIDIGAKAAALLPLAEASLLRVKQISEVGLEPGLQEEFAIIGEDDQHDRYILSLRKLQTDMAWERCRQLLADDVVVRGKVLAVNRGGVLVSVEGLRGFLPLSQIGMSVPRDELVGKSIPCKFMEVDEERTRLVLSNRRAVAATQAQSLTVGDVVVGRVQSLKPYGAFVEIGGVSGLLHISQISHDRVTNVESVLREGEELKVMVLSFDSERGRVSLSTKKLEPTPGDMLRNPQLVFEKADEMAKAFKERVAAAEAAARAEEARLQQEGFGLGVPGVDAGVPFTGFSAAF